MTNLDIALSLARAGFYVFPLTGTGKFLNGFSWDRGASRSPKQIRHWWANDPRQRIGIHCGRSGVVAVDVDQKNGKDGFKSLKVAGLDLPHTFSYTSRSGQGEHHLYRAPEGEQLTIDRDLNGMPGVDIRSGIGMIAYAGPQLTKKPRLAPAPEWALVHKKDGWDYDMADLEAWLDAEGTGGDSKQKARAAKARRMATVFPEGGIDNGDLLSRITPLVSGLTWGGARRAAYEAARARYTNDYPDPKYLIAFDRAWAKAITRVEADGQRPKASIETHAGSRTLQLTPASAIKPRPVRWLWEGRIAIGTLALLAGREGIGKSTLAYWLVAQITRGAASVVSRRDASDRARRIQDKREAMAALQDAIAGNDADFAHAIGVRARNNVWLDVAEVYTGAYPDTAGSAEALAYLDANASGAAYNLNNSATFAAPLD